MARLDWLTERPVAHRGLHDASSGVIENTPAAFSAAIAAGYGIETDLQISADDEAMVHHDDALGRLTEGRGRLAELSAAEIKATRFKSGNGRILALGELCDLVAGRTALLLELKSRFDGDTRVAKRAVEVLSDYGGPAAVMSFDPVLIESVRQMGPFLTRGIVAERHYLHAEWDRVPAIAKQSMAWLLHSPRSRPQFIAYSVRDLPALVPLVARFALRLPLLAWTVRNETDRLIAARWADQVIFEGWRP
jgi:glycerophosphoryl diester phosphodiesterase